MGHALAVPATVLLLATILGTFGLIGVRHRLRWLVATRERRVILEIGGGASQVASPVVLLFVEWPAVWKGEDLGSNGFLVWIATALITVQWWLFVANALGGDVIADEAKKLRGWNEALNARIDSHLVEHRLAVLLRGFIDRIVALKRQRLEEKKIEAGLDPGRQIAELVYGSWQIFNYLINNDPAVLFPLRVAYFIPTPRG